MEHDLSTLAREVAHKYHFQTEGEKQLARAILDALERATAALREDKEALDWLEKQRREHIGGWTGTRFDDPAYWRNPSVSWKIEQAAACGTYEMPEQLKKLTLREAIRLARKDQP